MWTVIVALLLGIIIGPLARLILPGRQGISLPVTILIGALGALLGSVIVTSVGAGDAEWGSFSFLALLVGVGVAIVLVIAYSAFAGARTGVSGGNTTRRR